MKRVGLLVFIFLQFIFTRSALASNMVISQVQLSGASTGTASQELIQIYNNSDSDIDITDWCVSYASSSNLTFGTKLHCFDSDAVENRLFATTHKPITLATSEFQTANNFLGDEVFSAGLAATSGHVHIIDPTEITIDRLGWGSALNPETNTVTAPASGKTLQRKVDNIDSNKLQDTDNNQQDFTNTNPINLPNETGLYEATDMCLNNNDFPGLQSETPTGYQRSGAGECLLSTLPSDKQLMITELLPNPEASDTDHEFIEIYNPHDDPIALRDYELHVGPSFEKSYQLPSNLEISPKQYMSFYNSDINFTLVNSTSRARLIAPAGNVVSEVENYQEPAEGVSWALFDDGWKMTQQPTPDSVNVYVWDEDEEDESTSGLAACPERKFRNPATNRCKNIESSESSLTPCAADQERNPETNRCRKIGSSSPALTPCKEGQERNPETNRCRKVGTDPSSLTPCQPGYERNVETNRCRKVVAANSALGAPAAINPVSMNNRIVAVLLVMAAGYAIYEYRTDIANFYNHLRNKRGDPRPPG